MIDPAATPREQIVEALKPAGDLGLTVADLVTATSLSHYVVLYTLRNMKDAGQVSIAEGGEKYQRDRLWLLNPDFEQKPLGRPPEDSPTDLEGANRRLIEKLIAAHPHGYENARFLPRARLDATGVTR